MPEIWNVQQYHAYVCVYLQTLITKEAHTAHHKDVDYLLGVRANMDNWPDEVDVALSASLRANGLEPVVDFLALNSTESDALACATTSTHSHTHTNRHTHTSIHSYTYTHAHDDLSTDPIKKKRAAAWVVADAIIQRPYHGCRSARGRRRGGGIIQHRSEARWFAGCGSGSRQRGAVG